MANYEKIPTDLKGKVSIGTGEKKKTLMKSMEDFVDTGIDNLREHWTSDFLKPNLENLAYSSMVGLANAFHSATISGINLIFRRSGPTALTGPITNINPFGTNYHNVSNNNANSKTSTIKVVNQNTKPEIDKSLSPSDIEFAFEADANTVLYKMFQTLAQYGVVGLDNFYEFAGYKLTNNDWNISNYGWNNLDNACVKRSGSKWVIDLPVYKKVRGQ